MPGRAVDRVEGIADRSDRYEAALQVLASLRDHEGGPHAFWALLERGAGALGGAGDPLH
ncbi:hypothetical protein AB0903_23280 [Streptomyces sp. NPDC048389]|uniref:hypothetical protein n=1 Tax=Streptomyces sp. NPDC048389 TaxID=3154622 RepID=UPI003454631C